MKLKNEDAIRIAVQCAKQYSENLNDKDFMFICGNPSSPYLLRTTFGPRNYMHLTGLSLSDKSDLHNALDFFRACITNRLSPDDIVISSDGTTELKLRILPSLMNLPKMARMVGDFSGGKIKLITEKLVGNIHGCMGFVLDGDRYVPNTALNYDTRNISKNLQRVVAVFGKPTSGTVYTDLCYIAKNVRLTQIIVPDSFVFSVPKELI